MVRREEQQLHNIETPHEHDVLKGRGNGAKDHIGNKSYRAMVDNHFPGYVECPKPNRVRYAKIVIDKLRNLDPPARFLVKDKGSGLWSDIGDELTLKMVRQRFREKMGELEKKERGKDGEGAAGGVASPASKKGKKAPPPPAEVEPAPDTLPTPTSPTETCFSQTTPAAITGADETDDEDSIEHYYPDEYEDYYSGEDYDQLQESLKHIEPLPISEDPIGPIDILHASCPEHYSPSPQQQQQQELKKSLIRRHGALDLRSAQDEMNNFIQRQHGSLDLSTEMKLMRSDPHRGKRESLNVPKDDGAAAHDDLMIQRQSGALDLTAAASAPGVAEAFLATQAEVRGETYGGGNEGSSQHVVSTVPLNDEQSNNNNADRTHMMKDRSRSGRRTKFSRATPGSSSGTMTISGGTVISNGENLTSVFEEKPLPDGFVEGQEEQQRRPEELRLADNMKKFSDMSLDDSVMRSLEGEKKLSDMSLDGGDSGGIAPTPLKDIIDREGSNAMKPGSNISLTLSQTVEYLGDSAFSTLGEGDTSGDGVSSNTAAQGNRLPSNIRLNEAKTFSEMSLDDGAAVSPSAAAASPAAAAAAGGNEAELAPTKLPSDFSLSLSQTGSLMGDSTFSNASLALMNGEREG